LSGTVGSRAFQNARLQKQFKKQAEALLQAAIAAYRAGRQAEVQGSCRRILDVLPNHFDALHLLGVCENSCGRFDEAEKALTRAVSLEPRSAEANSNLGLTLFKLRRFGEARKHQEKAIALQPNFPTALTNLGNTLMRLGLLEQAVQAHDRAIRQKPDYGDACVNRGMALVLLNRLGEAGQSFDRALALRPRHLQAIAGNGLVSLHLRHFDAARAAFETALAINPAVAEILAYRGWMHTQLGQLTEAEADFDAALAIDGELEAGWRGRAQVALLSGNVARAIATCNKVLEQNPASEIALVVLGGCYARLGEIDAAVAHFDRALAIKPDFEEAISKKIFALDFIPDADFAVHQAARREWWEAIGAKLPRRQLRRRQPDPDKRIVVGYVSYDFRIHSASLAFKPVLRHHDRRNFEVVCYSCSPGRDAVTEECQSLADRWVDAVQFSDEELADRIESDNVDILVDLSGHTTGNRLMVFARKPAPVQVTAWGSGTGTGLPAIDYFFADPVTVPPSVRHLFAEKVYDLPSVITIEPMADAPPSALPMIRNGYVTFGVFNRIDKISANVVAVWSKLLQALPASRIVIKNAAMGDPYLRDGLIGRFAAHGVSQDRIKCIGATTRHAHLAAFSDIDISLDPFPQNGGISTWESLQMGVPVVAKLGTSSSSRLAAAILKAVGLEDWVADDDDGYLAIAQKYASMAPQLEALRARLPAMLAGSEAGNVEMYTKRVEEGYRQFWRDYCASVSELA
jgi:predicted O-linked N-acetylglucosamine transferase (SPINDLY family)